MIRRLLCRLGFHREQEGSRRWVWHLWRARYTCRDCGRDSLGVECYR